MKLAQQKIKQIIAEELRSVLKEQSLFSYLTALGMSEDDIMDIMEKPGGVGLLNLFREFGFKKLPAKDFPQWERTTTSYHYTENGPAEIQTISDYGKYGIELKRHGPRWEARTGAQQRGYQTDSWDNYESAVEGITKLITPVASTMSLEEANDRGFKIADMIMTGNGQDAAHFIQMGIVPIEEIVAAIVKMAIPVYQNFSALKDKLSKLYSDLADYQRMGDYSMSDKLSWDINSVEKEIRQAKQPLDNIYDFWKASDVDGDYDYVDKVDMLLHSKELRSMVPGLAHAWRGDHDYDPDHYGIVEHKKGNYKMKLTQQELQKIIKEELANVLNEVGDRHIEEFVGKYRPGIIRLFRYSTRGRYSKAPTIPVDPMHFTKSRKSYSKNEWNTSGFPRSFWYADADDKESFVDGKLYYWDVPASRIYDFKKDPEDFIKKHRHPQYGYIDWDALFPDVASHYDGVYYTLGKGGQPVVAYFKWVDSVEVPEEIVQSRDFSKLEPVGG